MLTPLYYSYIDFENSTFTESETNAFIIRVFQIISSFLKIKYQSKKYTPKQIEDEAIELTAMLCVKNENGIHEILRHNEKHSDRIDNICDFEYLLFRTVRNLVKL